MSFNSVKSFSWQWFGLIAVIFLSGIALGWGGRYLVDQSQPIRLTEVREDSREYHFINPLLFIDLPKQAPDYNFLKQALADYIAGAENRGTATDISAYFRDLNSGEWTGINEDHVYDPSSLMKVAVMIGYLRSADTNPSVLEQTLNYNAKVDPGQHYPPAHPLGTGRYSVTKLIQAMIIDSDNVALDALFSNNRAAYIDVLKSLEILPPLSPAEADFMSPKTYSSIFRTLYNSSFLPRSLSEQALSLLTKTSFTKGLVAGVPPETIVAHKFGEHTHLQADGSTSSRELHDCGIVYYPSRPYLLCLMTKGSDFSQLETVLADLSRLVYQKISQINS